MRTMRQIVLSVFALLVWGQASAWALSNKVSWALVDECDRPLPLAGYSFHAVGGDRGTLNDADYAPAPGDVRYLWDGTSAYSATVVRQPGSWTFGGMFYSLIHTDVDNRPINFEAIFGPSVKPEYQGKIVGIEVTIKSVVSPSNNPDLFLKVEAKNTSGQIIAPSPWRENCCGPAPARSMDHSWP